MSKERIRIKRKGVYGEGFLSEPQSEQYRKIDQVEKKESPELVHEQLSALHSFNSKNPKMRERAEKDLKYSEKTDSEPRRVKKVAELSGNKVDIEAFHPSAYEEDAYAVRTHVVGKPYLDRYTTNDMVSAKSPEDAIDKFLAEKRKKGASDPRPNLKRKIVPNTEGTDLDSPSYGVDGHVRIEDDKIEVDVFDRNIKDADEAWIATEEFDNTPEGLKEANQFLKEEGFDAELTRESEDERRLNQENGGDKNMSEKCAPGEEWVEEYNKDDGTHVKGHCRRKHPHLTRADRRQDAKNLEDRRR